MGYSTKNSAKHERKQGIAAMQAMLDDPNFDAQAAMNLIQINKDAFGKLDDLPAVKFCECMADMRANYPDIYPVFWWWRHAEEKAGRRKEEDGDDPDERRHRTFMITQFLRAPFSDEWEDDRKTLKPGVDPWITEEQIARGLDHKTIKRWAWVWHDRDIYTEEDEIADRDGRVKAGEMKFKHAHIMVEIPSKLPVSTVARWFGVPDNQVTIMRGRGAFLDGVEYLVHESPRAVQQFKTHYNDDEVHASSGFDFRREVADLQAHRAKYGKRAGDMTPADTMRMHVMHDGWNMKMCRDDDPLTYAKIRSSLPPLRLDYLLDAEPCPFRMNIYVDGPGGIGKSSFCEYIAQSMFQGVDDPYFTIGNDERVTFDGYDGQPAIIWDDVRVTDFIRQFGSNGAFRILDPHPKKIAQQAKHSRLILTNVVNIINGVQPYKEFIAGLVGTYTDRDGVQHKAEDENQAWRRFPMILCVRTDDFTVLVNQGFVDDDLSSVQTMQMYANVRGSLKSMMQKLEGPAKEQALLTFGEPVLSARRMIEASHDKKISDPAQIPPEIMPKVVYCADSMEDAIVDGHARVYFQMFDLLNKQNARYEESRFDTLVEFACWFWSSEAGGFARYLSEHPDDYEDFASEIAFAQDDDRLQKAIEDCIPYFTYNPWFDRIDYQVEDNHLIQTGHHRYSGIEMLNTYTLDTLLEAVYLAWEGDFGEFPRYRGHKICPMCRIFVSPDMKYCGQCGRELPDVNFFEDIKHDLARYQLATERNCDVNDVPGEDVEARIPDIDKYADY